MRLVSVLKLFSIKRSIKLRILVFLATISAIFILKLIVKFHAEIYLAFYQLLFVNRDAVFKQELRIFDKKEIIFKSKCLCRQNEEIKLEKSDSTYTISSIFYKTDNLDSWAKIKKYSIPREQFESSILTCNLYNSLRRGPNLKVISYSLYGKNPFYYKSIKQLVYIIKERYPGWIIRIHYDNSIEESVICEMECLKNRNNTDYLDLVDFCNIEELPYDLEKTWNAKYMHGMTWRWLPVGDSFIDFYNSRDTDAWISLREIDSFNVWMNSNTIFHVMRDSPGHGIEIVGGYWGQANVRDRELANYLFKVMTNKYIASVYNPDGVNKKGYDQFLLTRFFSWFSYANSTTHDSYTCKQFNGEPWPTKRVENFCFVGCGSGCCDQYANNTQKYDMICPQACRPKNHMDWIYC